MKYDESLIWKKIETARLKPLEAEWLKDVYSLELSNDLRKIVAESLGLLSKEGWEKIQLLIKENGLQPELIKAAGLCHQTEAKDFLIELVEAQEELDIDVIQALACWGALLSDTILKRILKEPSKEMRLAGLELLLFKSHQLSDTKILCLTKELLNDFRDSVVIKALKILQRRNGRDITLKIGEMAIKGSDLVAKEAIMALSYISTPNSYEMLSKLVNILPPGQRRDLTNKQLSNQYRFSNHSSIQANQN